MPQQEATKAPGAWNVSCYHPEMKDRFGNHFFPSGTVLPDSSERSGEKTFGNGFVARPRDVPEPKIDRFSLDLHIGRNVKRENRKWYDDVVAATAYIGPMVTRKK